MDVEFVIVANWLLEGVVASRSFMLLALPSSLSVLASGGTARAGSDVGHYCTAKRGRCDCATWDGQCTAVTCVLRSAAK